MTMTDEQKKLLTEEVLGECYHEGRMPINCGYRCIKCGDTYVVNRTFDNDADMMALYRAIYQKGKWKEFLNYISQTTHYIPHAVWLFCLDNEDYEDHCCLVAEWLEVKK